MTFKINTIYDFNLVIDGVVIGIKARYTGAGETIGNTEYGHFARVLEDGTDGHTFKWSKATAVANQPKVWEEERAEF
tara:strand:+ start:3103 stop:3333 length:231 start_codon:yes stop_codon:yes gene_type:complete